MEKEKELDPSSLDPYSSSPPVTSLTATTSSPNYLPDSDGWQKPSKVARWRSSGLTKEELVVEVGRPAAKFVALGPLGDQMELGLPIESEPRDLHMVEYGVGSLKRGLGPLESSTSITGGSTSSSVVYTSPEGAYNQVSPFLPHMVGVSRGKGSNVVEKS